MTMVRKFRSVSVYSAGCIQCGKEIESETQPVPDRCRSCADLESPARVLGEECPWNHRTLRITQDLSRCPGCSADLAEMEKKV